MVKRLEIQLAHKLAAVSVVTNRGGEPAAGSAPGASRDPNANDRLQTQMQRRLDAEITQVRSTCNALNAAVLKLQELQENFVKQAEEQLLELAIEIAGKVLVQEIRAERYEIDPIVREAISRIPTRTDVVVHLHPDDLARCELAQQEDGTDQAASIRFVADPGVQRAECLLKTSQGSVESSVKQHLSDIAEALKNPE